jgi:hypothetical protein
MEPINVVNAVLFNLYSRKNPSKKNARDACWILAVIKLHPKAYVALARIGVPNVKGNRCGMVTPFVNCVASKSMESLKMMSQSK